MTDAKELRLWIEPSAESEPLHGCVEGGRRFQGWLGLMAAVEAMLAGPVEEPDDREDRGGGCGRRPRDLP